MDENAGHDVASELWERATSTPDGYRESSVSEVARLLGGDHPGVRIVDVREPYEWDGELGRVPGAELVPLSEVNPASTHWSRDCMYVMVCRSGGRSGRAASLLVADGFSRVINVRGGMLAWNDAALPIERAS